MAKWIALKADQKLWHNEPCLAECYEPEAKQNAYSQHPQEPKMPILGQREGKAWEFI